MINRLFLMLIITGLFLSVGALFSCSPDPADSPLLGGNKIRVIDAAGREVFVPDSIDRVICSGAGALRLLVYLQKQNLLTGVDSIEIEGSSVDIRPYALANPRLSEYPLIGEFRGRDDPELILQLDPAPQVIFKTFAGSGMNPDRLQKRTGIPVVVLSYGDLGPGRDNLDQSLRLMGQIIDASERAEEVIAFFNRMIADLHRRASAGQDETDSSPSCYVGGVAHRGPQGLTSTEPAYPPFSFLGCKNVAGGICGNNYSATTVAREQLVAWNPEIIFIDLATLSAGDGGSGLYELRHAPAFSNLTASQRGRVFGLLPYNSYAANFGSVFANAYFIGTVIYPRAFSDVETAEKADEIYQFLVAQPVFEKINRLLGGKAFSKLETSR